MDIVNQWSDLRSMRRHHRERIIKKRLEGRIVNRSFQPGKFSKHNGTREGFRGPRYRDRPRQKKVAPRDYEIHL